MVWAHSMGISFERDRDIPIGTQLEWGLRSAIVRGALTPGERLPPLRDLADEVGAHLNTIRSVYGRLEQDGLIETHQGKGSFVRAQPEGSSLAGAIEQAARLAHEAGVTPVELASALYVTPQAGADLDPELAERRDLREQIAVLERTLAALYAKGPHLQAPDPARQAGGSPHILTLDELLAQRDAVIERIVAVRAALTPTDDAPKPPAGGKPASGRAVAPAPRPTPRAGIAPA